MREVETRLVMGAALLSLATAGMACDKKQPAADPAPPAKEAAAAKPDPCAGAEKEGPLAWFRDDYARARDCAVATGRPLFIDMWAPWCHTCLSMQHTVLRDAGLAPLADRFVWLAIDTDREVNAEIVGKLPVRAWPTFFVVSPESLEVQARFLGATSFTQMKELLVGGEKAFLAAASLDKSSPLWLVREGDRAEIAGQLDAADAAYAGALAAAPLDWARRPDVTVSLAGVRAKREAWQSCFDLAVAELDRTGNSASASDLIYYGADCAEHVTDAAAVKAFRERARARLIALTDDAAAPLSVDDRSDALANLRHVHEALGDKATATATAERQRALLDEAAARAETPLAAMTYNWPRAEVYVTLGKGLELVPALEKSSADLPKEYDPPYRLAWVLAKSGKPDAALAPAQQALALAYGPRKARVASLIADIQKTRGDLAAEKAARAEVVKIYEALPEGQKQPGAEKEARALLAKLDALAEPTKTN